MRLEGYKEKYCLKIEKQLDYWRETCVLIGFSRKVTYRTTRAKTEVSMNESKIIKGKQQGCVAT